MLKLVTLLYQISKKDSKKLLFLFLIITLTSALLELAMLKQVSEIVELTRLQTISSFTIESALPFILLILTTFIFQITNVYLQARTATKIGTDWSSKVFNSLLSAQYAALAKLKGADILNYSVTETARFTDCVVLPTLLLISRSVIAISIVAILVTQFFAVSLMFFSILTIVYWSIYKLLRERLSDNSLAVSQALEERNDIVLTSFFNIKSIKLDQTNLINVSRDFLASGARITKSLALTYTFVHFPR